MESPIDIARRVWPGEWVNFPAPHMTIGGALFGAVIGTTKADDGWRVYLTTRGQTQRIALNADLAEALTTARQKVSDAVLELIRAVGVPTVNVLQDRDLGILGEILAERQRAFPNAKVEELTS